MLSSLIDRPALLGSELGLLLVGLVLTIIGLINFAGAFAADGLAFVGAFIFLIASSWCISVNLIALLGHSRSTTGKAWLMVGGWLGAAYPLSAAFTYFGSGYIVALPVAMAGIALALISLGDNALVRTHGEPIVGLFGRGLHRARVREATAEAKRPKPDK